MAQDGGCQLMDASEENGSDKHWIGGGDIWEEEGGRNKSRTLRKYVSSVEACRTQKKTPL